MGALGVGGTVLGVDLPLQKCCCFVFFLFFSFMGFLKATDRTSLYLFIMAPIYLCLSCYFSRHWYTIPNKTVQIFLFTHFADLNHCNWGCPHSNKKHTYICCFKLTSRPLILLLNSALRRCTLISFCSLALQWHGDIHPFLLQLLVETEASRL